MLLVDKIKDNRKLKIKKDENKLFGIEKLKFNEISFFTTELF